MQVVIFLCFVTLFLNSTLHNVLCIDASYFLLTKIYLKNFQIWTKCILCIWSLHFHATRGFKSCVSSLDVSSLVHYCIFTDLKVINHLGEIPFQYLYCCEDMLQKGGGLRMNPRWRQQEVAFPQTEQVEHCRYLNLMAVLDLKITIQMQCQVLNLGGSISQSSGIQCHVNLAYRQ